ncbi:hypothetical protein SCLCIDRAFT_32585 [Scleroderma citrinum Foug A]|uniref:Uncharacterized protein n=1 Tax=Scleroderma citrinum Foug A TaxID=1036808 RepID=A0A0C2YS24_9AGAM|nr:hypothetical protein SCLCIDRAFT_32585 [Scleroderma citrinum Foug A]
MSILQVRCILNGYRPKWNKFLELIEQLEKDRVHSPKYDRMCHEIAHSGMMGGSGSDDASDADVGSGDEFGIILD